MSPTLPRKKRKTHNHKKRPFYQTRSWKRASAECLDRNPYCVHCAMRGGRVRATTSDHIKSPWIAIKDGMVKDSPEWKLLLLGQDNLQSLCLSCHNKKSARDSNKMRKK